MKIGYDMCRNIWTGLTENMPFNNYFRLIITVGAPISWDRFRWSEVPWYYKKRTYLIDPPSDESLLIQVTCPELKHSISLTKDEPLDRFSRFVPIDDVEYLVKNGEPRSSQQRPGWQKICYNINNLGPQSLQRLLQASRVS
jgi:hypothetical protein